MRRTRLGAFGAVCVVLMVGAATGVSPAASPLVNGSQAFAAGSPTAISCSGTVGAQITLTGHAGTTGAATDVMLVLDLSGSAGEPPSKLADLKRAATDTLDALDAADGSADHAITGNGAGIVIYQGTAGAVVTPLGSSYATLLAKINALPATGGGSPHAAGIGAADTALAASTRAKAMVLITDGQSAGTELSNATTAATTAKGHSERIVPIGIGGDVTQGNLTTWASDAGSYQSGTTAAIDKTKLLTDLGALVAAPASFTATETLGPNFSAVPGVPSTGSAATGPGVLVWSGSLAEGQTATLGFTATRNGTNVFATTNEVVGALTLAVSGGSGTVTPPGVLSIDILPCGATPIAAKTCTGAACTISGSQGGTQYTADAGASPAGTAVSLSALNAPAPPASLCPGFAAHTTGAEFDVRPLSRDATIKMVIPKASLGTRKWFQTDVCIGTNLRFITAIQSLSNLSPEAVFVSGGALPGRYWGLLPSIPRIEFIPGRGFVIGPWITSRSQDSAGNAVITFRVPFISGSTGFTTDGKAGYDPKFWG
jgi:hypothetical protein